MQSFPAYSARRVRALQWPRRTPAPSLITLLFPAAGFQVNLATSVLCVGMIAGLAQARFFLPGNPVPVTLQTLGVLLTGGILSTSEHVPDIGLRHLCGGRTSARLLEVCQGPDHAVGVPGVSQRGAAPAVDRQTERSRALHCRAVLGQGPRGCL